MLGHHQSIGIVKLRALTLSLLITACQKSSSDPHSDQNSSKGQETKSTDTSPHPTAAASESDATTQDSSNTDHTNDTDLTGETEVTPTDMGFDLRSPKEAVDINPDPNIVHVRLEATRHQFRIGDEIINGFAYNDQVPGPTIRAKKGDRVIVDFTNRMDIPTTVHWHGLHVPFAMDGVTWKSSPVGPQESFHYDFIVNQSGTYWYHPHFDTQRQMDLGLYGAFIIDDPTEPKTDRELVVLLDAWGELFASESSKLGEHNLDGANLRWTCNGKIRPKFRMPGGQSLRLRIINVSNSGYTNLTWPNIRQIASDQGLLPQLNTPASVLLANGDRVEAEVLVGGQSIDIENQSYSPHGGRTPAPDQPLFRIEASTVNTEPNGLDWPFSHKGPTADPGSSDIVYTLHGELSSHSWRINGEKFPDITIHELPGNQDGTFEVRNLSASEHPFHLHGYGFEVLSINGVAPKFATIEDTWNLQIRDQVRFRISGNNPGDWMAHCHILPHQHAGMMTVLRVLER